MFGSQAFLSRSTLHPPTHRVKRPPYKCPFFKERVIFPRVSFSFFLNTKSSRLYCHIIKQETQNWATWPFLLPSPSSSERRPLAVASALSALQPGSASSSLCTVFVVLAFSRKIGLVCPPRPLCFLPSHCIPSPTAGLRGLVLAALLPGRPAGFSSLRGRGGRSAGVHVYLGSIQKHTLK